MAKKPTVTKSKLLEIQKELSDRDQQEMKSEHERTKDLVKLDKPKLDMSTVTEENVLGLLAERSTLLHKVSELTRKLMYAHIPKELTVEEFNFCVDRLNKVAIKEFKEVPDKVEVKEDIRVLSWYGKF